MEKRARIVDLDRGHSERVRDPMELVALALIGVGLMASLWPRPVPLATTPIETASPSGAAPSVLPRVVDSLSRTFTVATRPAALGACGVFSETTPRASFAGGVRALFRLDLAVSVAADPGWRWCVAGARVHDDGVELVGRFGLLRDHLDEDASRTALASATFSGYVEGFGPLGTSELARTSDGFAVLPLRAVTDSGRRGAFVTAVDRARALTLRMVAVAGPWTFDTVPLVDGPLHATAVAHGARFTLRDLKLLPDAIATTPYGVADSPDPAVVMLEWRATDDRGTRYRARPDVAIAGALPGFYRSFEPAPPVDATTLSFSIRRVYLTPLREFAATLPFQP